MPVFILHDSGDDDERGRRALHGIAATFGKTAGPAEAAAVASTAALAWMAQRQHRRSSRLTVAAAGCLAAAHAIFWSVVQPANVEMMRWPLDAIPRDWA